MPKDALSPIECRPAPTTRSAEMREKALQSLALRSLTLVQQAHEAAWPRRVPPLIPSPQGGSRQERRHLT